MFCSLGDSQLNNFFFFSKRTMTRRSTLHSSWFPYISVYLHSFCTPGHVTKIFVLIFPYYLTELLLVANKCPLDNSNLPWLLLLWVASDLVGGFIEAGSHSWLIPFLANPIGDSKGLEDKLPLRRWGQPCDSVSALSLAYTLGFSASSFSGSFLPDNENL